MQLQFDASRVAPSVPMEVMPTDWYTAQAVESELAQTQNKQGSYVNIQFELLAGPYKGRRVFARHTWQNANQQAVEIGQREMSALCHATGVLQLADTQQLHGRPVEIRVKYVPAEGVYEEKNEVRGYRAQGSGKAPAGNGIGKEPPGAHASAAAPSFAGAQQPVQQPPPNWGAQQGQPASQQQYAPPAQQPAAQPAWTPPAQQAAPQQAAGQPPQYAPQGYQQPEQPPQQYQQPAPQMQPQQQPQYAAQPQGQPAPQWAAQPQQPAAPQQPQQMQPVAGQPAWAAGQPQQQAPQQQAAPQVQYQQPPPPPGAPAWAQPPQQ